MSAKYSLEPHSGTDRTPIEISEKALSQIGTLKTLLEIGLTEEARNQPIPIQHDTPRVILCQIVDWCEHHKEDTNVEVGGEEGVVEIPDWDRDFLKKIDVYDEGLYDITVAANFLSISKLYRYACKFIYESHVKGKSTQQIRDYFGEDDDFTPEEREQIEEENKWFK